MKFAEDLRYKQRLFKEDGLDYSLFRVMLADGSSATALYRLMRFFDGHGLAPLTYLCQILNKLLNQCVIGAGTELGDRLAILHPVGIVINSRVVCAGELSLESGVVIGSEKGDTPKLGTGVFVGSGAKVIGPITIGDGAKIGANAVVVKDVPDNTTVVGIPAKPIRSSSGDTQ